MVEQPNRTPITMSPDLLGVRSAYLDAEGFLHLCVAGRELGPPTMVTDARRPFVALSGGLEGGGEEILAEVAKGSIVFWRTTASMSAEPGDDEWNQWKSPKSESFSPFVSQPWMHHFHCTELHPIVACTMLSVVVRCFVAELLNEESMVGEPGRLEQSLVGLAKVVPVAFSSSAPNDLLDSRVALDPINGIPRNLIRWIEAVRSSLSGATALLRI